MIGTCRSIKEHNNNIERRIYNMCAVLKNVLWNNKAPNEQRNNSGGEKKWTITLNDLHNNNIIVIVGTYICTYVTCR